MRSIHLPIVAPPLRHRHALGVVRTLIDNIVSVADRPCGIQVVKCGGSGLIGAGGQQPNFARSLVDKAVKQHSKNFLSLIGGAVVVFTTAPFGLLYIEVTLEVGLVRVIGYRVVKQGKV